MIHPIGEGVFRRRTAQKDNQNENFYVNEGVTHFRPTDKAPK
ncbi:hypothetical protein A33Q_4339 [Indibacter alkaliphilus LW1]|uniref:Uncharacterized protein n=1 Tax=Indibacter alkaliphilus (strain CCUG 57479 / KCTC 22604 / LW1) TaxID=1189612 RepID=S2DJS8_INDAL|nr:hypothetical protein A33Q_4339 [Indibacter alkaliphilus LW1]